MIIDALRDTKTVIKVSSSSLVSDKIANRSLSFLGNDLLLWNVDNSSPAYMTIDFATPFIFDNLIVSFSKSCRVKLYYSHDGYSWEEFNYFSYKITTNYEDESIQKLLHQYEDQIFKVEFMNRNGIIHTSYSLYDPTSQIVTPIDTADYSILKQHMDTHFLDTTPTDGHISINYVFHVIDRTTGLDSCIYKNLLVNHIKIKQDTIYNATDTDPQKLTQLQILASADINIDESYPSTFVSRLFSQKYFADYNFEPSIATTFLEMLESASSDCTAENSIFISDIKIDFNLNTTTQIVDLNLVIDGNPVVFNTDPLTGIQTLANQIPFGSRLNTVYIWTIKATKDTRFVYTKLMNPWTDLNAYLKSLILSQTNFTLDFEIHADSFRINRTKQFTYSNTEWMVTDAN